MVDYGTPSYGSLDISYQIDDALNLYYYRCQCSARPPAIPTPIAAGWTQSNAQEELASMDSVFKMACGQFCIFGQTGYFYQMFRLKFEDAASTLTWKGYVTSLVTGRFYIYYTFGGWSQMHTFGGFNTEYNTNFTQAQMNNAQLGGYVYFLAYGARLGGGHRLYSDYIKIVYGGNVKFGTPAYGTPSY